MKKALAIVLALVMTCALLAGCNNGSNNNTPSNTTPSTNTQTNTNTTPSTNTNTNTEPAQTGTGYPKQTVTVIIPFSAGGGTDLFGRIVVEKMSSIIGQPIVIENIPGGSATIGTTQLVNSDPDGYTLELSISSPLCLVPNLGETSYTVEDVRGICNAYTTTQCICVPNDSEIKNFADLVAFIDGKGGVVSYGGTGTGNQQHLSFFELINQLGKDWDITQVAYNDDATEAVALMSGEVPFCTIQAHGAKSYIENGQIRPVLVFGDHLPAWMEKDGIECETSVGLGYECNVVGIIGFYGPKGISDEVVEVISNAYQETIKDQAIVEAIANIGLEPDYMDPDTYNKALQDMAPAAHDLMLELGFIEK